MGKWTTEYYDNVLGAKMKSLVSGAIKRARLEKAEPTITYEAFVEDLDRGDSFTTSLIEVLVKEVAERRYRHHTADRGLIGERTARSLRKLSSPASIYRERPPGRAPGARRGVDLTEYLSQPPDELDVDEDDDELGPYGTFVPVMEGTRLNTDLYDAYRSQHSWSNSSTPYFLSFPHASPPMSSAPPPDAASDRVLPPLVDASPPGRTNVWPLSSSSGFLHSTLSRQPSIRRPGRNRMSDFSEFTAARRNSTRQHAPDEDNARTEPPAANNAELPAASTLGPRSSSAQARRFFPFGRTRRFEIIPTPRPAANMSDDWYFPPHSGWTTNPSERSGGGEEPSEERSQAPRLRRGGLRAPESLLSRHSSPPVGVPTLAFPTAEELQRVTTAAVAATPAAATVVVENRNENNGLMGGDGVRPVEERVQ